MNKSLIHNEQTKNTCGKFGKSLKFINLGDILPKMCEKCIDKENIIWYNIVRHGETFSW